MIHVVDFAVVRLTLLPAIGQFGVRYYDIVGRRCDRLRLLNDDLLLIRLLNDLLLRLKLLLLDLLL